MGKTGISAAIAASLLACAAQAQTSVYRWVDKDGKVHFSSEAPPPDAANVTEKRMGGGGAGEVNLPYATQQAMKTNPVTLYIGNQCGDLCTEGRALLDNRGIPYAERNAEANRADADKLKQLVGSLEVPVLLVGDKPVKGWDAGTWNSALDSAGYPRTKLPGQPSGPRAMQGAAQEPNAPK